MLRRFKKQLRYNQTDAEQILWYNLRNRHFYGAKFRRQHAIRGYIVDFVCLSKKLVIELDGGHHAEQIKYDAARTRAIMLDGFKVLRFWNNEVLKNLDGVCEVIHHELFNLIVISPSPASPKALRPLPPRGEAKKIVGSRCIRTLRSHGC